MENMKRTRTYIGDIFVKTLKWFDCTQSHPLNLSMPHQSFDDVHVDRLIELKNKCVDETMNRKSSCVCFTQKKEITRLQFNRYTFNVEQQLVHKS